MGNAHGRTSRAKLERTQQPLPVSVDSLRPREAKHSQGHRLEDGVRHMLSTGDS